MPKFIDLSGQRFGRLTVIKRVANKGTKTMWECKCSCGNVVTVEGGNLKTGHVKSCGCYWREVVPKANQEKNYRHGDSGTKLHKVWANMRYRCNNPKCKAYPNYGGRGIRVCEEWSVYETFRDWALANGYKEGLSIDRINNDGDYEPNNCRWTSMEMQINNRRVSRKITYRDTTRTISEWSKITGINRNTINERLRRGWTIEETLTKAPLSRRFSNGGM